MIIEWRAKNWSRRLMRWRADKIICNLHLWWLMAHRGATHLSQHENKISILFVLWHSRLPKNMHIKFALTEARLSSLKYENFRYPITGSRILYFFYIHFGFFLLFFFPLARFFHIFDGGGGSEWIATPRKMMKSADAENGNGKCINILPRARKSFHRNENSISQFEK